MQQLLDCMILLQLLNYISLSVCREISKEEFKKVMAFMRAHNRQGLQHRHGLRGGLHVQGSVENGGLVEYFFGKDGQARLQLDKFLKFMKDLQEEVSLLSFSSSTVVRGVNTMISTISININLPIGRQL